MTSDWRPIESAPRDGTAILGIDMNDSKKPQTTVQWEPRWTGGRWYLVVEGENAESGAWTPTHWQPLPKPPGSPGASLTLTARDVGDWLRGGAVAAAILGLLIVLLTVWWTWGGVFYALGGIGAAWTAVWDWDRWARKHGWEDAR